MSKFSAKQLFEIVREVVRDEVKKSLPAAVKECLTEKYLRQMMVEVSGRTTRPRPALAEQLMGDPEEEIQPEELEPAGDGIYQKSPLLKPGQQQSNEIVRRLVSKDSSMSALYEGVKPLPREGETPAPNEIPEHVLEKIIDKDVMRRLAFGNKPAVERATPNKAAEQWEESRLARLRESLDRPVNVPIRGRAKPNLGPVFDAPDNPFGMIPGA